MHTYKKNSITLLGAVGMGLGVIIGAGIFALPGQIAELAGKAFPLMFAAGGIVTAFSAYSYIKLSNSFPSAGGIGMFLVKEYGKTTIAASASLMMAFSMVINQSLVAKTFATYTLQLFGNGTPDFLVPLLGVLLLGAAFIVNIKGNKFIQSFTSVATVIKIAGLLIFAIIGLWLSGFSFSPPENLSAPDITPLTILASTAFTVLAFKGFTTITNSGAEIVNPEKNVGRAIVIAIVISLFIYMLVSWAIFGNLSIPEIVKAKDYALAQAARPAFGGFGLTFTVVIAIVATISGIIASIFAVSRMLAMLTEMKLIPHSHFGMSGSIQRHTLVYTVVLASILTIFFDLGRIASMGAILYLVMDMVIHFGLFTKLRGKTTAKPTVAIAAFLLDAIILFAFLWVKIRTDWFVAAVAVLFIAIITVIEFIFIRKTKNAES